MTETEQAEAVIHGLGGEFVAGDRVRFPGGATGTVVEPISVEPISGGTLKGWRVKVDKTYHWAGGLAEVTSEDIELVK